MLINSILRFGAAVAGRALVQLLLAHLAVTVGPDDLIFVHRIGLFRKQPLNLVPHHPQARHPNILVHGRGHRADHPAVPVAAAHRFAHPLRRLAFPQFVPTLLLQIAHDLLFLGAVAGHHVAVGVNKKGVKAHVAGQKPLLAVNIIDQAVVEIGPHPLFRAPGAQQLVHQVLKMLGHHRPVVDDVVGFHKVKAVVQAGGGKLHAHLVGDLVQTHQVRRVPVLDRHAEAHVLHAHLAKGLQCGVAPVEAVLQAPDLIVSVLQALDRDADAHLGKFLAQINDPVREKSVGGDHDPVAFFVQLPDNVLQILPDERLAAGDIGKIHPGQLGDGLQGYLLLRPGGGFIAVAHIAPGVAPVGHDHRTVKFFRHFHSSKSGTVF